MKEFAYIVPSLGRCGSQLMTVALHNNIWGFKNHEKGFLKMTRPFIREYPTVFNAGCVYKTHLYPTDYPKKCKVVFTFGDPLSIILSVYDKSVNDPRWGSAHFANFDANFNDFNDLLKKDVLNLENMFDCFYKEQTCDIICLRYETLWENVDIISNFLGWSFELPEKRERKADLLKKSLSQKQIDDFNNGYKSLIEKINSAEDAKIWRIR